MQWALDVGFGRATSSMLVLGLWACDSHAPDALAPLAAGARTAAGPDAEVTLQPPPLSEGVFPCSDCHANLDPDPRLRVLEVHGEITLAHGARERWCFDCHNPDDRDHVRLAGGTLVSFSESHRLCGQCHGDKLRDWRLGVHGKRTGSWNGPKEARLCAHCHDPHVPRFQPIVPSAPPTRPQLLGAGS
jgi:hypothetical protein